jgi:hypothetical protein
MAWRGREGVVYVCGEWEHGQLGLPLERSFGDPTSIDPPPTPYQTPVPSTGVRINDKGEELYPLPAIDSNEAVSHPGAFEGFCETTSASRQRLLQFFLQGVAGCYA